MKKVSSNKADGETGIPETNFSRGVRGRYASALKRDGYTVRVYRSDGTAMEKQVLGASVVSLDPDVQAYFPDSRAVNRALRKLIPTEHETTPKRAHGGRRPASR